MLLSPKGLKSTVASPKESQSNNKILAMHIDKVKQFWMEKQRARLSNGDQLGTTGSVKTRVQRQIGLRKQSLQDRGLEGEYITKEGRIDQVNYSKQTHFRVGYD